MYGRGWRVMHVIVHFSGWNSVSELWPPIGLFSKTPLSLIRSQNKMIIYYVYNFFKDIYEQTEHFSNINVCKTQRITAKSCGVHRSTVQNLSNEGFNSLPDNQVFAFPRKTYKGKRNDTDINGFNKNVLSQKVHDFYDKGEYPTATELRKIMEEKIGFSGS